MVVVVVVAAAFVVVVVAAVVVVVVVVQVARGERRAELGLRPQGALAETLLREMVFIKSAKLLRDVRSLVQRSRCLRQHCSSHEQE